MISLRSVPILLLIGSLWLSGCSSPAVTTPDVKPSAPPPSTAPSTPLPTGPTPEPLAAIVNGSPITLAELELEILRFESAQAELGIDLATLGDYRDQVLQALIDRMLLSLGARQQGFQVTEADVIDKLQQVAEQIGGEAALDSWLASNGYTAESLQAAIEEDMLAGQLIASLVSGLAQSEEQVHARHILVSNQGEAEQLQQLITTGADFAALAGSYSQDLGTRMSGGDLGWFPTDFLTVPEVETAAFGLQPGELSPVVESLLGYHIVETLERGEHPLSPEAMRMRREQVVKEWLARQREVAQIEVFASP